MSEKVQPGVEIDKAVWEEFRENIKQRQGGVRGHLRSELENAIRLYIGQGDLAALEKMDRRMARMEQELGIAHADGGAETLNAPEHTHAPAEQGVEEKPPANSSTDKKVAYLAQCVRDRHNVESEKDSMLPRSVLVELVKEEYGFRPDTAKRYVERLVDHFGLREHPRDGYDQLVTEPKYNAIVEEIQEYRREEAEADADSVFGEFDL